MSLWVSEFHPGFFRLETSLLVFVHDFSITWWWHGKISFLPNFFFSDEIFITYSQSIISLCIATAPTVLNSMCKTIQMNIEVDLMSQLINIHEDIYGYIFQTNHNDFYTGRGLLQQRQHLAEQRCFVLYCVCANLLSFSQAFKLVVVYRSFSLLWICMQFDLHGLENFSEYSKEVDHC